MTQPYSLDELERLAAAARKAHDDLERAILDAIITRAHPLPAIAKAVGMSPQAMRKKARKNGL